MTKVQDIGLSTDLNPFYAGLAEANKRIQVVTRNAIEPRITDTAINSGLLLAMPFFESNLLSRRSWEPPEAKLLLTTRNTNTATPTEKIFTPGKAKLRTSKTKATNDKAPPPTIIKNKDIMIDAE
ncbi:hypothetical protein H9L17_02635 [Thermomonas brevis]|uniref:Uncharacterized protein n=1 Tax=Thermomonas brevis TaxID=215691 RepID=A0A7G9QUQ7_9GAMM|nr:hypothetical protein [Thermomonas brevis]QNN47082.1 hypothetical protein H9L17_02635 [Thermomonas brevis]